VNDPLGRRYSNRLLASASGHIEPHLSRKGGDTVAKARQDTAAAERVMIDGWKRMLRQGANPLYVALGVQHWVDIRDSIPTE